MTKRLNRPAGCVAINSLRADRDRDPAFLAKLLREERERDRMDLEILNRYAEGLNVEAADVLGYQIEL